MSADMDELSNKIARFQLRYNATPHAVTRVSPAQLLFQRNVTLRLDLIKPRSPAQVGKYQDKQKEYRGGTSRKFEEQDTMYAKNMVLGASWIAAVVSKQTGPVSYHML